MDVEEHEGLFLELLMKRLLVLLAASRTPPENQSTHVDAEQLLEPTGSPGMRTLFVKIVIMFVQEIPKKQRPFTHLPLYQRQTQHTKKPLAAGSAGLCEGGGSEREEEDVKVLL